MKTNRGLTFVVADDVREEIFSLRSDCDAIEVDSQLSNR
ncbi:hypothetical protein Riv7116_3278 [Rivularia sp. PCC 7116]|nr:hypothetical protein Riv7116_3278 [Rivularia sp. PCC 7116]